MTFALIALVLASLSAIGGWYSILAWPCMSFVIVALAYLLGDVRLFGKRADGTRHWMATSLLLPYLLIVYLVWSAEMALSNEPAVNNVNESLAVSRRLRARELPSDVVQVCDLTCEFVDPRFMRSSLLYACHPILDAGTTSAVELIELAKKIPPPSKGRVLIHCAKGHGRTAMVAAVWLAVHGYVTFPDEAITLLRSARPGIWLRPRQRELVIEALSKLSKIAGSG